MERRIIFTTCTVKHETNGKSLIHYLIIGKKIYHPPREKSDRIRKAVLKVIKYLGGLLLIQTALEICQDLRQKKDVENGPLEFCKSDLCVIAVRNNNWGRHLHIHSIILTRHTVCWLWFPPCNIMISALPWTITFSCFDWIS